MGSTNSQVAAQYRKPMGLADSTLARMPMELILSIVLYLPPESTQVFALTCKALYFALGTKHVNQAPLGYRMDHRYSFYHLLVRDLHDHIYCYYCGKLHNINQAHWHLPALKELPRKTIWSGSYRHGYPPCLQANCENYFYIHANFTFVVLQMAMKRYRQGREYDEFIQMLSYPTITGWMMESFQQTAHDVRISKSGRMMYRQQIRCKLAPPTLQRPTWNVCARVCPHFSMASMESFETNKKTLRMVDGSRLGTLIQCRVCLTEFRVDLVKYGKSEVFFLTKWLDLGEGHIPTDPAWQNHVLDYFYDRAPKKSIKFPRGSIFRAFEEDEPFRFKPDSLFTTRDKKALCVYE